MTMQLVFDVVAIAVAFMNSFDRPYTKYGDVVNSVLRDGAAWFIVSREGYIRTAGIAHRN